jgi:hypothetical protein
MSSDYRLGLYLGGKALQRTLGLFAPKCSNITLSKLLFGFLAPRQILYKSLVATSVELIAKKIGHALMYTKIDKRLFFSTNNS